MSRKRFTAEQIIVLLWEADVNLSQGQQVGQTCRDMGITEQTYYRWRKKYGGIHRAVLGVLLKNASARPFFASKTIRSSTPNG